MVNCFKLILIVLAALKITYFIACADGLWKSSAKRSWKLNLAMSTGLKEESPIRNKFFSSLMYYRTNTNKEERLDWKNTTNKDKPQRCLSQLQEFPKLLIKTSKISHNFKMVQFPWDINVCVNWVLMWHLKITRKKSLIKNQEFYKWLSSFRSFLSSRPYTTCVRIICLLPEQPEADHRSKIQIGRYNLIKGKTFFPKWALLKLCFKFWL